ncbi:hypothetical protein M427DRAFT_30901 [Gonapodya prolifera JEL478]|uniref:Uncharacterized protein n=1 Tax=Gonapodya prolifera (strain JEL478) TaxID=1344416 RepID=A0A139AJ87_GONPJ|nr:hypothetical protein M427DRAFT_30901 [Gonapodya prolifera JEL478]|eukprot:KXS16778.1 hypothetical protein M427DRAFT_30901 [Gonapodya prolifera JEL478]
MARSQRHCISWAYLHTLVIVATAFAHVQGLVHAAQLGIGASMQGTNDFYTAGPPDGAENSTSDASWPLNLPLRIISHNIRYAPQPPPPPSPKASTTARTFTPTRIAQPLGEAPWDVRLPFLITQYRYTMRHHPAAFICLQEVMHHQLIDLLRELNAPSTLWRSGNVSTTPVNASATNTTTAANVTDEWSYVGVGRDDGLTRGEYSPVIYRPRDFALIANRTLWLSQTPSVPSKGWDASSHRIVTLALFRHRVSGKKLLVSSTHLDDVGKVAREKGAKLIADTVNDILARGFTNATFIHTRAATPSNKSTPTNTSVPTNTSIPSNTSTPSNTSYPTNATSMLTPDVLILAGDLNSLPSDKAYLVLSRSPSPFSDTRLLTSDPRQQYGHVDAGTYTGFPPTTCSDGFETKLIDFVFAGPREGQGVKWAVEGHAVLESHYGGVWSSDHRPVVGDLLIL